MDIAIIGATGNVGTRIVAEAIGRGHTVTGILRDPARLGSCQAFQASGAFSASQGDVSDPEGLAAALSGRDAVVSAVTFVATDPETMIDAVRRSGVKRYVAVGGAGSLEVAPGKLFIDEPDFPQEVLEESRCGKALLYALRDVDDLDWTMLAPSALITAGERTGQFRLGSDSLIRDEQGKSWISYEDFAVAILDEIEEPCNVKRRFTVGY